MHNMLKICILIVAAVAFTSSAEVDADAIALLKKFSSVLVTAKNFRAEMNSSYEVVQEDGQRLEFGGQRKIFISRPGKIRIEFESREGQQGMIIFDGKDIYAYSQNENVYAIIEQTGTINESIAYLTNVLSFQVPMNELFSTQLQEIMITNTRSAHVVGDAKINGVMSDHVAIKTDFVDFQLWLSKGEKLLLQRIIISYKTQPGNPQFRANFSNWDFTEHSNGEYFTFTPPLGSEHVPLVVPAEFLDNEEGESK